MFLIDKLATAAIAPLGTAILLGLIALMLAVVGRQARSIVFGVISLLWLIVWSLPVVSYTFQGLVEARYPYIAPGEQEKAAVAVVLGGAVELPRSLGGSANLNAAADRLLHAARLYHAGRVPRLLVSGGSDRPISAGSEAEEMASLLVELGVPDSVILREARSRNTRQNAAYSAELLAELNIDRVLLVTSALHMRRAVARFEDEGLDVRPAATDHESRSRFTAVDWAPSALALDASGRAFKEIVGYWVGR